MKLEKLSSNYQIFIEASPREADLAIVSIDSEGNLGQLNEFLLTQYGYSINDLPKKHQLDFGFGSIPNIKGKPILFVVTIDGKRDTLSILEQNLYSTLTEFRGWVRNKRVWLPLMGTGSGGLTFEESYNATVRAINRFQSDFPTEAFFIISLPAVQKAKAFYELLKDNNTNDEKSIEKTEEFLKSFNCNFYLAGAFWSGEDQIERFLKENIWEKGHEDDSYSDVINKIKKGDIIILKSAFSSNAESILRIKGMGIVTEVSEDGGSVSVDWRIKDISYDIPILGKYRRTIAMPDFRDVITIFSYLNQNELQKLSLQQSSQSLIPNKIAGLLSDTDRGTDFLDISKDILAFARVIAARSFEPPLAIALFGKWGSGKSFFMRKLKEQIIDFSTRNANNIYCEGVVHIHFNAWSYMDANLWASIVSKIFEGLNEYITANSWSDQAKKEIEAELSASLNITKEELMLLTGKRESVQKQIDTLETKFQTLKEKIEEKIKQIEKQTTWNVINNVDKEFQAKEKVIQALNQDKTFIQTDDELKKVIPEKYWENPEEAYSQIISKYTFLKEFCRRDKVKANIFWIAIIIVLILIIPILLGFLSVRISQINFVIPQAGLSFLVMLGVVWRRAEIVNQKLQPIVASFWNIKEDYKKKKAEALGKFEQEEKILKFEIQKEKEELLFISEQLQKAENTKADIEFKMNNAIATEALYSFIEKRSKSEDYKKHLGIISIIRRDFEILNGLFTDHHQEIVDIQRAKEFRNKFRKPLERIVLYVDDLDRCPEENVVEVLEAVNLLMAFPLFIVIVGVDPRWVKNALIKKYALQFTGKQNGLNQMESGIELIDPASYLEKIFQIPFHLKDAPTKNVKEMIRQLAILKPSAISSMENMNERKVLDTIESKRIEDLSSAQNTMMEIIETTAVNDELNIVLHENIELLILSEQEIYLMQEMGEIIGPNPRALKRFVNIYRIVKAHDDYTISQEVPKEDLLAVLFLLALSIGQFKKLVTSFEIFIEDEKNKYAPIASYFQSMHQVGDLQNVKHQLDIILSDNSNYQTIQQIKANVFNTHNLFIKLFTFKNI